MIKTIAENGLPDKICHQIDMGLLQEVIPPTLIEELLETYQMWEERERKTNMVTIMRLPDRLASVSQLVAAQSL